MGRLPSDERKYQLQDLNDTHHEILRLTLLGYRPKQIARMLGVTEPTVCNATCGAKGRMQLQILRGARDADTIDLSRDLMEFAQEAFERTRERLRDPNLPPALGLKYDLEMIGLAGFVKPQRVQVQGSVTHLTSDEILQIKQRAKQLALESGVIDGEYVEQGRQPEGDSPDQEQSEPTMPACADG